MKADQRSGVADTSCILSKLIQRFCLSQGHQDKLVSLPTSIEIEPYD